MYYYAFMPKINKLIIIMMIIENTIDNSPKVPRANFLGSDGLFCLLAYVSYKR